MRRQRDTDSALAHRRQPSRRLGPTLGVHLLLWLPLVVGCSAEATLRSGGRVWLWTVAPILLFAVVRGPGVALDRRRPARRDARLGPRLYLAGLALVVAATVVFVACNLAVEIPPESKLANLGAWFGGAVLAAGGGVLVERRSAAATKSAPAVRPTRRRFR